jgi:hypothetical protein
VPPRRTLPCPLPSDFLLGMFGRAISVNVPTYLVVDAPIAGYVLRPFPKWNGVAVEVHSNDHPPPHIHVEMPPGAPVARCLRHLWNRIPVTHDCLEKSTTSSVTICASLGEIGFASNCVLFTTIQTCRCHRSRCRRSRRLRDESSSIDQRRNVLNFSGSANASPGSGVVPR